MALSANSYNTRVDWSAPGLDAAVHGRDPVSADRGRGRDPHHHLVHHLDYDLDHNLDDDHIAADDHGRGYNASYNYGYRNDRHGGYETGLLMTRRRYSGV